VDRADASAIQPAEQLSPIAGILLGVIGSGVGAVLSLVLRAALNASGIMLPPPPGATHGNVLHVDFIPLAYATGFAVMSLTLLVAAWWPARRAARLASQSVGPDAPLETLLATWGISLMVAIITAIRICIR